MTVLVWVCSLPIVALLVLPFFGTKVALAVALILLLLSLAACRLICLVKHGT